MFSAASNVLGLLRGGLWLGKVYVRYNLLRMASTHSKVVVEDHGGFSVTIMPALEDNFMYLIRDHATNKLAVVDPADPDRVKAEVEKIIGGELQTVLTTHHHWDHAGGNAKLLTIYPNATVVGGGDRVESIARKVTEGDLISVGIHLRRMSSFSMDSVAAGYFIDKNGGSPAVFTGDTLFLAGCGKFFEGTPEQMYSALIDKLSKLPGETKVYCGHEYSLQNLKFAKSVEQENDALDKKVDFAKKRREDQLPVPPSTISEERAYNPFMRVSNASEMGAMRERKNNFK